jgi:hypothetical protein
MKLYAAESTDGDRTIGGFVVEFESGIKKVVAWQQNAPILPPLEAAKMYTARLIEQLLKERHMDEVEFTNWASATAAVQKIITDWNDRQTQARFTEDLAELAKKSLH